MQTKILNVFYGQDYLPYKDKELSVHYPVSGATFQNANLTSEVHFYFDKIGGTNTTWVANTKLPNGKIGSQILQTSSDENGNYAIMPLTTFHTQYKGEIYVCLQGYEGDIEYEYDDDTDIYTIHGTPVIGTTGSIKLNVAYSTGIIGSSEDEDITLQVILAYLGEKLNIVDGISVQTDLFNANVSGFDDNQVFFDKTTNAFYKFDAERHLVLYGNKDGVLAREHLVPRYVIGQNAQTGETFNPQLAELNGITYVFVARYNSVDYLCHFQGGKYRAISLNDLTSYYSTNGSLDFSTLIVNGNKDDLVHDSNLKSKIYPFFNAIVMTSGSKSLSASEIDLITNNPNTKIYYNGIWYDRDRVNSTSQPVFINYDFAVSNGDLNITTRAVIYNTTNHTLNAGSTQITTLTKAQINSNFAHSVETTINATNYVLTTTLKDANGNVLSSDNVDLPLESIVVSAQYYDSYTYGGTTYTKVIVITLATTSVPTIIPVGDLVDGLVSTTDLTANYYNKTFIDSALNLKADKSTTYTKTEVDNLLGAKANDNAVVHKTGDEIIAGVKSFSSDIIVSNGGTYPAYFGQATNYNYVIGFESGGSKIALLRRNQSTGYTEVNGSFSAMSGGKDLGSATNKWNDLYLSGAFKDGTNSFTIQDYFNYKAEVNKKLAELFEAVIEEGTVSYTYLQWSALPNNVDGQPIIYSGGSEMTNVKGNSCVFNQLANPYADYETNFTYNDVSFQYISKNHWKLNGTASATGNQNLISRINLVNGHKYLVSSGSSNARLTNSLNYATTKGSYILTATNSGLYNFNLYIVNGDVYNNDIVVPQIVDLTIMGLDSLTTVDEVRSALLSRGINIDEYNAYNEGSIKNSKPTSLVVHHFNLCDEVLEPGSINSSGQNTTSTDIFRTKNYQHCEPNTTYCLHANSSLGVQAYIYYEYDKNNNFISATYLYANNQTFTTKGNTYYLRLCFYKGGTTWGTTAPTKDEAQICINLSNATLNGTYKPYQAPDTYALDLPVLRGVGTAQDDKSKVRVGVVDLGTIDWIYQSNIQRFYTTYFQTRINDTGSAYANDILCSKYKTSTTSENKSIGHYGTLIMIWDDSYTDENTLKTALSGTYLVYQLATPTDQVAITLPDDIAIADGDSFEITYDSTDNCGADFDFAVATSKVV